MELILELETEQKVIRIVDLPSQNSILEVKLPEDVNLRPNHSYKWTLKIIHSEVDETENSIIEGTIKVVSLTAIQKQDIQQAQNSLEKAEIYAQFYLWNETLTTMLALRDTEPKQWEELLESINFEVSTEINTASVVTIDLQN